MQRYAGCGAGGFSPGGEFFLFRPRIKHRSCFKTCFERQNREKWQEVLPMRKIAEPAAAAALFLLLAAGAAFAGPHHGGRFPSGYGHIGVPGPVPARPAYSAGPAYVRPVPPPPPVRFDRGIVYRPAYSGVYYIPPRGPVMYRVPPAPVFRPVFYPPPPPAAFYWRGHGCGRFGNAVLGVLGGIALGNMITNASYCIY